MEKRKRNLLIATLIGMFFTYLITYNGKAVAHLLSNELVSIAVSVFVITTLITFVFEDDSKYVSRRSQDWLKVINWKEKDVYLTGYKKKDYGWLCAVQRGDRMVPVGVIEYGGSPEQRKAFYQTTAHMKIEEDDAMVYLQPQIKAKVKFRNWTNNGRLRIPVFLEFL